MLLNVIYNNTKIIMYVKCPSVLSMIIRWVHLENTRSRELGTMLTSAVHAGVELPTSPLVRTLVKIATD